MCSHPYVIGVTCLKGKVWFTRRRQVYEAALMNIEVVLADRTDVVCVVNYRGVSEIVVDNYQK
jgi:hypothetical protein